MLQQRPGRKPRRQSVVSSMCSASAGVAQQRPGRKPRRQVWRRRCGRTGGPFRSTKAGAQTPATAAFSAVRARSMAWSAQQRPGRKPRRHQLRDRDANSWDESALNKGRGANPGDSGNPAISGRSAKSIAQQRPGRKPRRQAFPFAFSITGPFAQQRPGRKPRRQQAPCRQRHSRRRSTLNKGRGVNPGDSHLCRAVRSWWIVGAQQRPVRKPRRQEDGAFTGTAAESHAQQRPGRKPRRQPLCLGEHQISGDARSTKAGA